MTNAQAKVLNWMFAGYTLIREHDNWRLVVPQRIKGRMSTSVHINTARSLLKNNWIYDIPSPSIVREYRLSATMYETIRSTGNAKKYA